MEEGGDWAAADKEGGETSGEVVDVLRGRLDGGGSASGDEEGESEGEVLGCIAGEKRLARCGGGRPDDVEDEAAVDMKERM